MLTPTEQAARNFCNHPQWNGALWLATTYQWHPTGEMPPVMGLLFADWIKGLDIFRGWVETIGHADEEDDLRVAVMEGEVPGQAPGYTVRISPTLNDYLDGGDPASREIGLVVRMHPQFASVPGMDGLGTGGSVGVGGAQGTQEDETEGVPAPTPNMLERFKREYTHHGEFMLAPVVQHNDGQLYMDVRHGIIKRELILRQADEIGKDEPDMLALRACNDGQVIRQTAEYLQQMLDLPA